MSVNQILTPVFLEASTDGLNGLEYETKIIFQYSCANPSQDDIHRLFYKDNIKESKMKKNTSFKRPHIATLDEITITREGETATIEYKEKGISGVHLTIGKEIDQMSDEDILKCHNDCIYAQLKFMRNYKYLATEIPPGKPQVEYFKQGAYWTARGDVLRCHVGYSEGETAIVIDDQEFTMNEFGKIISTFEGWGMRVTFVPEDETYKSPAIEIRDPSETKVGSIMLSDESVTTVEH